MRSDNVRSGLARLVGLVLRRARCASDRSQRDVAASVGVHRGTLRRYESGRVESMLVAERIAIELGVDLVAEVSAEAGRAPGQVLALAVHSLEHEVRVAVRLYGRVEVRARPTPLDGVLLTRGHVVEAPAEVVDAWRSTYGAVTDA